MEEVIIQVKGLSKSFQVAKRGQEGFLSSVKSLWNRTYTEVIAVKNIDLTVNKGEIRGLIGPNGAGKSTTIKMLTGILHPNEGEAMVMGYVPWLEREDYVKNIGALFGQKSQLWWDIPAIDTFSLQKIMYNIDAARYTRNLEFFKEVMDVADIITRPVRQLSLGERMKCELVCTLLHEPELIFLDEPTIGLDIIAKESIRNFIKQVNKEKQTTFIITTHDMSDIENLCDRVTVINHGAIVFDNDIDKIKTYFSEKKIIDVKFTKPMESDLLEVFKVISFKGISASIEINTAEHDLQTVIQDIFRSFPLHDININNISIEEVIKEIYGRAAS